MDGFWGDFENPTKEGAAKAMGMLMEAFDSLYPPHMDSEEHKERLDRIRPYWFFFTDEFEHLPISLAKDHMIFLMEDLKEEGNWSFKEEMYSHSHNCYSNALRLAKTLQVDHSFHVGQDKVASLFCNRAAVFNKLGRFREAIDDADLAVSISNGKNYKACYRLAMAYRELGDTRKALKAAESGYSIKKSKDFKALIVELKEKLDSETSRERDNSF
ncbi:unnamed protein product, partial [Owenia fusiformis]